MQIIKHRMNLINELESVNTKYGVEIDIRSDVNEKGSLHLSHDAWIKGEPFENWLKEYANKKFSGPLILNTKEDGLEEQILNLLKTYNVNNFFFLDTTMPSLVKWSVMNKIRNFAVRYSRFEPIEQLSMFRGFVDWCWVDCFNGEPVRIDSVAQIKKDFKICLVSPELQNSKPEEIRRFKPLLQYANAVCTKFPENWELLK